jgi:hypothetical protein
MSEHGRLQYGSHAAERLFAEVPHRSGFLRASDELELNAEKQPELRSIDEAKPTWRAR